MNSTSPSRSTDLTGPTPTIAAARHVTITATSPIWTRTTDQNVAPRRDAVDGVARRDHGTRANGNR
jgi:hypothetical protein